MYVRRMTIQVKQGRLQELLALVKETWEKAGAHFYIPLSGNLSVFAMEWEFDTMAAMGDHIAGFAEIMRTFPKSADVEKFDELVVSNEFQTWHRD